MTDPGDTSSLATPRFRTIDTPRLRLRTLSVDDAEDAMSIVTRDDIMRWTSRAALKDLDQCRRWLADRTLGAECFNFAMELKNKDGSFSKLIGMIGTFHLPGVGYMIHPDHAGKGYTTEALTAVLPALWAHLPPTSATSATGYDYIEGCTDTENFASQHILRKCGFTYIETRLQDFFNPTLGVQRDTAFYRLARPGGKTLEEMGMVPGKEGQEDGRVEPPIQ